MKSYQEERVDLSLSTRTEGDRTVVVVGGEIDVYTAPKLRAHEGSLRLVCTQERILKIFRITGLTKVFPIHASVEEAVAATD